MRAAVLFCTFTIAVLAVSAQTVDKSYLCNKITWGSYVSYPWVNTEQMTETIKLDTQFQRPAKIVHWYANWDDGTGDFVGRNNEPLWLKWATSFTSLGFSDHIPMITWQPWAKQPGGSYSASYNQYPMSELAKGTFDDYLKASAGGIKTFGKTLYLRPFHEFDLEIYPWGAQNTNPTDFIAGWRHMVNVFKTAGVTNVKWVWCPNHSNGKGVDQTQFFPGDDYIDFACMDVYSQSPKYSFYDMVGPTMNPPSPYERIAKISTKPILIAEFGVKTDSSGPSRASWYNQLALDLPSKLPRITTLVHYNEGVYSIPSGETETNNFISSNYGTCPASSQNVTNPPNTPIEVVTNGTFVGSPGNIVGSGQEKNLVVPFLLLISVIVSLSL